MLSQEENLRIELLYARMREVAPVTGGTWKGRTPKRLSFADGATEEQKQAAYKIAESFDWNIPVELKPSTDDRVKKLEAAVFKDAIR